MRLPWGRLLRRLADKWIGGDGGRACGPVPHLPAIAVATGLCVLCGCPGRALRHGSAGAGP